MTKKNALISAISALRTYDETTFAETIETLNTMVEQLSAPRHVSDETKARANAKRKNATAVARAELVAKVAPVLREGLTHTTQSITAKELFSLVQSKLPADFTAPKVQNILLREMKSELEITESKGKANTYRLAE